MKVLGLDVDRISSLARRLESDFSADTYGFALFADDLDRRSRAHRSDETVRSAWAIARNLMETRLHEQDLATAVGDGLRIARPGKELDDSLRQTNVDRHIVGFFRAFGSTLDTLAAAAVGVLRVPFSITRASFNHLTDLRGTAPNEASSAQRTAWADLHDLLDDHRGKEPEHWLRFSLDYRNSVVHRARPLAMNVPMSDDSSAGLIVVTNDPVGAALSRGRFQPHLRRRPWSPDLDDLIESRSVDDIWLGEPACITLSGLRSHLNELVEDAVGLLMDRWHRAGLGDIRLDHFAERKPPRPAVSPGYSFRGFAEHAELGGSKMVTQRHEIERVKLANRLRDEMRERSSE